MNIATFKRLIESQPESPEQKYIFLTDNEDLASNVLLAGFRSLVFADEREGFFNLDSFLNYLDSIELVGTCLMQYLFVPSCLSKKRNDILADYFKDHYITYREGWKLFRNKEYLMNPDHYLEMKKLLQQFIDRYEKAPESEPDLDRFHIMTDVGKPSGPLDIAIVEQIVESNAYFVIDKDVFIYRHGVYIEDLNGTILKDEIRKLLYRKFMRSNNINRIYALLLARPGAQRRLYELYNFPAHWINFQNGFYDPITQEMIPHDPKYLTLNQIPYEYYPEKAERFLSGGETIRKYMSISLPDPIEQRMFWQYAGYCMTTDTQMQKFLIITGNGGTGKSVLIDLVQDMVGFENLTSVPLQDLNKRFFATGLFGKLLNACGDIPVKAMESTDIIKKAVGEDSLVYEKKNEDALFFFSRAKLMFSCNGVPENVEDKSDAFYRRLLILEMNHVITAEEMDKNLKQKIRREMDYAISKAMQELHELYTVGEFSVSLRSLENVAKVQRASDSVKAFLDENICRKEGSRIEKSLMYKMYDEYCMENGRKPLGKSRFMTEMERKGYYAAKYQGIYKFKDVAAIESDFQSVPPGVVVPFSAG